MIKIIIGAMACALTLISSHNSMAAPQGNSNDQTQMGNTETPKELRSNGQFISAWGLTSGCLAPVEARALLKHFENMEQSKRNDIITKKCESTSTENLWDIITKGKVFKGNHSGHTLVTIHLRERDNFCVDLFGNTVAEGQKLVLYPCSDGESQVFEMENVKSKNGAYVKFVLARNPDYCISANNLVGDSPITLQKCDDLDQRQIFSKWRISDNAAFSYIIPTK